MSAFADSSALVKLYADEPGHESIRPLEALAVSALARVEVPAAFWRKQRAGELGVSDATILTRAFEADILGAAGEAPRFSVLAVLPAVLEQAAELVAAEGLRAYDAVQLGSALAARAADPECRSFACFDSRLSAAAAARGFEPIPAA